MPSGFKLLKEVRFLARTTLECVPGTTLPLATPAHPREDKNRDMTPFVVECVQFCCIVVVLFFCTLLFIALIIRLIQDSNARKVVAIGATAEDSDATDELKKV
ncbi:hypothetical protein MTO96_022177 [Rhipicephalus appendiculatus]